MIPLLIAANLLVLPMDAIEKAAREREAAITKLVKACAALTPEAAAPIFKRLADDGRLDLAAAALDRMKERNAARFLEALEPSLALQLLDRIRHIRANRVLPVAPPPRPVS